MPDELPPSIAFMLDEFRDKQLAVEDVRRKLSDKLFVRDYFDQCRASIGMYKYADHLEPRPEKFDIYAGSGLDPLSFAGKCSCLQCVIDSAHHFARTACLYADRVVIPDPFSFTYIEATDEEIYLSLIVLKILKPLVEAGLIVFGPAAYLACDHCTKARETAEKQLAKQLWSEFRNSAPNVFKYKEGQRWYMSFGSSLFTHNGVEYRIAFPATREAISATRLNTPLKGKNALSLIRQYRNVLQRHFAHRAHSVVFNSNMGSRCNTTVVTNLPEEALGYRLLDRRKIGATTSDWSMLRTVPLPAMQNLTASQAMCVREEAQKALPAFRAKLQKDLMSLKDLSDEAEERRALEVAVELRSAARELQGQLASIQLPSIRRREKLFAGLALAFEIVALGSGNPATVLGATGTFAALMIAAHQSHRDRQEKQEVLVHQPAYVLLTAERVLKTER